MTVAARPKKYIKTYDKRRYFVNGDCVFGEQ